MTEEPVTRKELEALRQELLQELRQEVAELRRQLAARPASRATEERLDLRKRILEYLRTNQAGISEHIAREIDSTKAAVSKELQRLVLDGLVEREQMPLRSRYTLVSKDS